MRWWAAVRTAVRGAILTATLTVTLAATLTVLLPGCAREAPRRRLDAGRLGTVSLFVPDDEPDALVFLFSDRTGWTPALDDVARTLRADGTLVVGVDLPAYLRGLAASDDGCHYVIAEIEALSGRLQREFAFGRYRSPVLAGIGAGGTLAYAALAQSPAATVGGAVSVDMAPMLGTKVPLCAGAPHRRVPGGFRYGSKADLPGWWRVSGPALPPPLHAIVRASHGRFVDASGTPGERLVAALEASGARAETFRDLPIHVLPTDSPGDTMAVIYSGDGGWRDLDKTIGEWLADHDVPVVGVDSLRYFWAAKTPDETAADLADVIEHFGDEWGTSRVVLVGYSFGAAVLPFAYNRLPAADRARVVEVALLGLEPRAAFEIRITGWLGSEPGEEAPAVLPEIERMPLGVLQCFYGEDEEDTLCRDPHFAGAEVVHTTGGHHFDGDYEALAGRIRAGAVRRAGALTG